MFHDSQTRSNERATGQGASLKRVFACHSSLGTLTVVTFRTMLGDFEGQENNRMQKTCYRAGTNIESVRRSAGLLL